MRGVLTVTPPICAAGARRIHAKGWEKDIARSYAGVYKRLGRITPQPCHCGAPAEMHHTDYDQPLKVEWLCREHHLALHRHKAA